MSGRGKPDQIQIFCVQLEGIAYLGAQSRTQRSIKSRIDPLFVIERIKDENSFGRGSAFLGPTAARNNEGNNEAYDRVSHWGNSSRAKGHSGLHRPPAFADASASHGRPAGLGMYADSERDTTVLRNSVGGVVRGY